MDISNKILTFDTTNKIKVMKIVYMDGYDEVRDSETQNVIFSTKLPVDLQKDCNRMIMNPEVIDNVVNIWNSNDDIIFNFGSGSGVDEYLLNEENCSQEEREIINESLYDYVEKVKFDIVLSKNRLARQIKYLCAQLGERADQTIKFDFDGIEKVTGTMNQPTAREILESDMDI